MGNACKKKAVAGVACALAAGTMVLALVGCAPRAANEGGEGNADRDGGGITVSWSADMACGSCHADEQASTQDAACLGSVHEQNATTCESCHGSAEELADVHEGATADAEMPKKLSGANKVKEETCLSCHGSWEELAEKTVDVTDFTDERGTTVNPHALDRTIGDHQTITCTSCHTEHAAREGDVVGICSSCHHEGVYECYTCHD